MVKGITRMIAARIAVKACGDAPAFEKEFTFAERPCAGGEIKLIYIDAQHFPVKTGCLVAGDMIELRGRDVNRTLESVATGWAKGFFFKSFKSITFVPENNVYAIRTRTNRRMQWRYADYIGCWETVEAAIENAKQRVKGPFEYKVENIQSGETVFGNTEKTA